MRNLNKKQRRCLEETFGPRVNFDPTERKLYGHDIAAMPGLFMPFVGDVVPLVTPGMIDYLRGKKPATA